MLQVTLVIMGKSNVLFEHYRPRWMFDAYGKSIQSVGEFPVRILQNLVQHVELTLLKKKRNMKYECRVQDQRLKLSLLPEKHCTALLRNPQTDTTKPQPGGS